MRETCLIHVDERGREKPVKKEGVRPYRFKLLSAERRETERVGERHRHRARCFGFQASLERDKILVLLSHGHRHLGDSCLGMVVIR